MTNPLSFKKTIGAMLFVLEASAIMILVLSGYWEAALGLMAATGVGLIILGITEMIMAKKNPPATEK